MHRKHVLERKRETPYTAAQEHLMALLRVAYPQGFSRVLVAPDGRLRILVVDDQFNGVDFVQKHKYVLDGLNRAVERRELAKGDLARVSSIDVYGSQGLV